MLHQHIVVFDAIKQRLGAFPPPSSLSSKSKCGWGPLFITRNQLFVTRNQAAVTTNCVYLHVKQ